MDALPEELQRLIVEKLCLDPSQQHAALFTPEGLAALNARRMMDTVRGMLVVDNMDAARRVLLALNQLAKGLLLEALQSSDEPPIW